MATRIYFGNGAVARTYAVDGSDFTSFGSASRYVGQPGLRVPIAPVTKGVAEATSSRTNVLLGMFVVENLAAQTITGTVKGQIRALESNAAADMHLLCNIRVVGIDGTERGELFANSTAAGTTISSTAGDENYELDTTATNRKLPPGWSGSGHSVSSVACSAGDAVVIEVGYRSINTVVTSYTGTIHIGSDSTTDLPENETETADYQPWIEFSHDFTFLSTPRMPSSERAIYVSQYASPRSGQIWPRGTGRQ